MNLTLLLYEFVLTFVRGWWLGHLQPPHRFLWDESESQMAFGYHLSAPLTYQKVVCVVCNPQSGLHHVLTNSVLDNVVK